MILVVSPRVKRLVAEAAELPEDERLELAQELLRLLPEDETAHEWVEEIRWRIDRIEGGESTGRAVSDDELSAIFFGRDEGGVAR